MVLSTIHVSQAHIFEKQSRCRESGSSVSTVVPVPGFFLFYILSIGHVWRSQYPQSSEGSREERYWNIVDAVSAKTSHFRIYNYRTVHRANMTDYVHRANGSNILHGMNALIAISDAGESLDCAAMAIGQSRHLGGGFLVPADFSVSVCQSDDDFEKGIPTWLK